jgi:hypothetical protein
LKKRTKKLLIVMGVCGRSWARGDAMNVLKSKSFLVLFFKKELLPCLALWPGAGVMQARLT